MFCLAYDLKAGVLLKNLIVPTMPILGCVCIIIMTFIVGRLYGFFLDDYKFTNYYLVLLGGGYLSIAIILSNIFLKYTFIFFICSGIASDYFIRESFLINRIFEDRNDKLYFISLSMLLNLCLYGGVFPEFFMNIR
ncbi:hypothetical protein HERIO_1858 [Hepatospora eriocheir]|uniref:Uncharacterized protein n=1 Tax=Hepatospora eriocheir TaxID=1081669 RepID=A0A1X0Q8W9_9MICR|nr:hypothetical protein HERIO_1858 [Hepatospora eriocheir]